MIVNEKYFHKGNIALGKTTAQTSTCSGGYSPRAVNGDTRTDWIYGSCTHTCEGTSNWWRVDFGKSSLVHSVKITNRGIFRIFKRFHSFFNAASKCGSYLLGTPFHGLEQKNMKANDY